MLNPMAVFSHVLHKMSLNGKHDYCDSQFIEKRAEGLRSEKLKVICLQMADTWFNLGLSDVTAQTLNCCTLYRYSSYLLIAPAPQKLFPIFTSTRVAFHLFMCWCPCPIWTLPIGPNPVFSITWAVGSWSCETIDWVPLPLTNAKSNTPLKCSRK